MVHRSMVRSGVILAFALFTLAVRADDVVPVKNWEAPPYWRATVVVPDEDARPTRMETLGVEAPLAVPTPPLAFVGITPCRVADTRDPSFPAGYGTPFMPGGALRDFVIVGRCAVPGDAQAVSFNFTVVNTAGPGFLLTYPAGGATPSVSTLNYSAGQVVANAAIVPLGAAGAISVIPGVSGFDLIIDVNGYYSPLGAVVNTLNGASGVVTISQGSNVTVSTTGQDIRISATNSGGTITGVTAGTGLTGGGTTGTVTLGLAVPLDFSGSSASPMLTASNSGSGNGITSNAADGVGVLGAHTGTTGTNQGVLGITNSTSPGALGVQGNATATSPTGFNAAVGGYNASTNTQGVGVIGWHAGNGIGVDGTALGTGSAMGVSGRHMGTTGTGAGVQGVTNSTTPGAVGVQGNATATSPTGATLAVGGYNASTNAFGIGVNGFHAGDGVGVKGAAAGANGTGVQGGHDGATGNGAGVAGYTNSEGDSNGVQGSANHASPTGWTVGVMGFNNSANHNGAGVGGHHNGNGSGVNGTASGTGNATGVVGAHTAAIGTGPGVAGGTNSGDTGASGVVGNANANNPTGHTRGVFGFNAATNDMGVGVIGYHAGDGIGVQGGAGGGLWATGVAGDHSAATGIGSGVRGQTNSADDGANGVAGNANAAAPTGYTTGVHGYNAATNGQGAGVYGEHQGDGAGVLGRAWGPGFAIGVDGRHANTTGPGPGVRGLTNSVDGGAGVWGSANATAPTGFTTGVTGGNNATNGQGAGVNGFHLGDGTGVNGTADGGSNGTGVAGTHTAATGGGPGVMGSTNSVDTGAAGVRGNAHATNPTGYTIGVSAYNAATNGEGVALYAVHASGGRGVVGLAGPGGTGVKGFGDGNLGIGIWGVGTNAASAGVFDGPVVVNGDLTVNGTLSKTGGSFRIDHPLEPGEKYLVHSFVESSEMKNVYDGVVTTDGHGFATVTLPDWFEALNRDFRYQLTVHGDGDSWARARVYRKIDGNSFVVQTDQPAVELSWQVTGVRKDAWAEKNRLPVEEAKSGAEKGRYLHPELFGEPETLRIRASGTRSADR